MSTAIKTDWPRKVDVLGVAVSPTTYGEAVQAILAAAHEQAGAVVSCHGVSSSRPGGFWHRFSPRPSQPRMVRFAAT